MESGNQYEEEMNLARTRATAGLKFDSWRYESKARKDSFKSSIVSAWENMDTSNLEIKKRGE